MKRKIHTQTIPIVETSPDNWNNGQEKECFEPIKNIRKKITAHPESPKPAIDYKRAYERQKNATKKAEDILEKKSRELYQINQSLSEAYNRLKEYKAQLLQREKLASIGQLSAGVAHEINNPASYIKSNLTTLKNYSTIIQELLTFYDDAMPESIKTDILKKRHDLDIDFVLLDLDSLIEESLNGTIRIKDIVKNLKSFSNPSDERKAFFSLNDCLQNTINLVWNELKYKCTLSTEFEDFGDIEGYPGEMNQVFLNLLVNASHAIDENGNINIKTRKLEDKIHISIEDNGCGINKDHINKIFDPFFTTKDVNKGSGLGLSITHGIIKKHNGTIEASSELGKGTRFDICFPLKNT